MSEWSLICLILLSFNQFSRFSFFLETNSVWCNLTLRDLAPNKNPKLKITRKYHTFVSLPAFILPALPRGSFLYIEVCQIILPPPPLESSKNHGRVTNLSLLLVHSMLCYFCPSLPLPPCYTPMVLLVLIPMRILYNYPPKRRWIVVDIYRDAKRRGIYPPLFTDPEGDSCFSIYQIRWIKKTLLQYLFLKLSRNDAPFLSPFAKQWIAKDIPSYGSQSKRAKIAIHWFGKY